MKDQHELESVVKEWLETIKPVPLRNMQQALHGRAHFLGTAVSMSELPRQKGWISIFRKERYAMNVLLSILVITGLLFGGGATVSAVQNDLPNEPLYGLKTWTEDLSLQFQNNEEAKVTRLMELAQIRVQEMVQVVNNGEPIPDEVPLRLEQHLRQAMQICANMDDDALDQALLKLRERLQEQERIMEQLQLHAADPDALQLMLQTRTMLQQQLRLVEEGLQNREMFRVRVQNGFQFGQDDEVIPPQDGDGQQQNGKPEEPGGPNTDPGGPNTDPGGPNTDTGGNTNDQGGTNDGSGGSNTDSGGSNNPGTGSGSDGSGGTNSNNNGSGGGGKP
jgi:uncharacterized membrane protein YgcG